MKAEDELKVIRIKALLEIKYFMALLELEENGTDTESLIKDSLDAVRFYYDRAYGEYWRVKRDAEYERSIKSESD